MPSQKHTQPARRRREGDKITVHNRGDGAAIAAGRGATATINRVNASPDLKKWYEEMEKLIDAKRDLPPDDKTDLKRDLAKVAEEISKGKTADPGRLESFLNRVATLAPDILEVAIATLISPLAGIGLVAKKIGDRAKVEQAPS